MPNALASASPPPTLHRLAADILADAAGPDARKFGERKVFLCSIRAIDLHDPACLAQLDALRRAQLLCFARADLVAAMDPALVAASEWRLPGTEFHFLVIEDVATARARAADLAATDYPVAPRPAPVSPSGRVQRAAIGRLAAKEDRALAEVA